MSDKEFINNTFSNFPDEKVNCIFAVHSRVGCHCLLLCCLFLVGFLVQVFGCHYEKDYSQTVRTELLGGHVCNSEAH